MFRHDLLCMIHPASRLEVVIHARADGRNAVKSAAYAARSTYHDERHGQIHRSNKIGGLLSHELFNWNGGAQALWNAAEKAETRRNARVIRELRPSLPAELPLTDQVQLVRGFSLWLRDKFGVAVQADIHAPRLLDREEERLHKAGKLASHPDYEANLFDPEKSNRNFHAHILLTTRAVCRATGVFGAKTRILDDMTTGPEEILRIRQEWEKRTNSALKHCGSTARVDLRSYADMAKAGDAPSGLVAQDHLGPRRAERSRRLEEDGEDTSDAGQRRAETKAHNEAVWASWLNLRALEREKGRLAAEKLAREREASRKKKADAEKHRLRKAQTAEEAEVALSEATQFDSLKTGSDLASALAWALSEEDDPLCAAPEFSSPVDLETYEPPAGRPLPEPVLPPQVQLVRRRGPRSR